MSSVSSVSSSTEWLAPPSSRPSRAEMFAKVDTDGDGSVNVSEFQSLLSDISQKTGVTISDDAQTLLSRMDVDGNGTLSQDELDTGMKEIMPPPPEGGPPPEATASAGAEAASSSGAGAGSGGGGASVQTYDSLDTNEDGVVSIAERMAEVMLQEYSKFSAEGVQASSTASATSLSTFA